MFPYSGCYSTLCECSSVPQHWIIFHHPKWSHDFKDSITTHFINPRYVLTSLLIIVQKKHITIEMHCDLKVVATYPYVSVKDEELIAHKIKGEIASLCAIDNTNNVYIMYCAMKTTHSTSTKIYLQSTYHKHHYCTLVSIIFNSNNVYLFCDSFASNAR